MIEVKVDALGVPLFRLTLLGANYSGKTSLANSLLNNVPSPVYKRTDLPELYYCVVRLSFDDPLVNEAYDDINTFCFEIEDTCTDDLNSSLDMRREKWIREEVKDYTPFGIYDAPSIPLYRGALFKPISQRRMSFLVLFDVTSRESFLTAVRLVELILSHSDRIGDAVPVLGLVANKIDLVRPDFELFDEAELFAQSKTIPFYRISALTKKNMRKMINEIAFLIYGNVQLWEIVIHGD